MLMWLCRSPWTALEPHIISCARITRTKLAFSRCFATRPDLPSSHNQRVPMSKTEREKLSHEERTAEEPRSEDLFPMKIGGIDMVNDDIRLIRLTPLDTPQKPFTFLPGQWLDVHLPDVPKAGGFTITSTPEDCSADKPPRSVDLAIQKSPDNPPAAWLWRPVDEVKGTEIQVRPGGSFVWPPPGIDVSSIKKLIFIAGGVGINPLISILNHLHQTLPELPEIQFLYSSKVPVTKPTTKPKTQEFSASTPASVLPRSRSASPHGPQPSKILFLKRLLKLQSAHPFKINLSLFLTETGLEWKSKPKEYPKNAQFRRFNHWDIRKAVGEGLLDRKGIVAYVCGPPRMTDKVVGWLREQKGITVDRVLCEKWW